jgi:hypothetical protein
VVVRAGSSLAAAFVTGDGLLAAMGHSGDQSPPVARALTAGLPALVFGLLALLVWYFGRQAERYGHSEGRTPVIMAFVIVGGFVAMNLFQLVAEVFV